MTKPTKIYEGAQGSIEVLQGAFGHNIVISRNDGVWEGRMHTTDSCVGDFSKERLQDICDRLQAYIDTLGK